MVANAESLPLSAFDITTVLKSGAAARAAASCPLQRQPLTTGVEAGDGDAALNVIKRCGLMIQFPLLIPFLLKRLFA
ncbi:MAG: hypothetical protein EHM38_00510 [Geobacteraceae bacterium]|nr:MAG: hypothetical protein EHM38_03920 [Geobacteraceae bacterium]RPI73359.1 MAG: hypothetical protein EHM38_00510 [Geobacteraceae bacterium]